MSDARRHHPDDPRSKCRQAIEQGDLATARVWAQLANAEAMHRLAKTIGREFAIPSRATEPIPLERGRHRRVDEQPAESEQAA